MQDKITSIDDFPQQKQAQGATSPLEKFLADARLHLVETGTRNRLVHTPRASKRTRSQSPPSTPTTFSRRSYGMPRRCVSLPRMEPTRPFRSLFPIRPPET